MSDEILQRLEIMYSAAMITDAELAQLRQAIDFLETAARLPVAGKSGAMFVSHLAMMLGRVRQGEEIATMPQATHDCLLLEPDYPRAVVLLEQLTAYSGLAIPQNELPYVRMHLCALMLHAGGDL